MKRNGAMTRTPRTIERLAKDNRGAIMLTGLFMSFSLVGALWFIMGVGDAIIFRDRMQEAADTAAFTSAAISAKGMNFISACNIVMLVLVIVHIVLGIIHDFALAACILSLGIGCGGWVGARNAYTTYAGIAKPILTGIHFAEDVAAYGYPWLGTLKGFQMGSHYGNQGPVGEVTVLAVGESNVPGGLIGRANHGLPVGPKPMNYLCEKVVGAAWDFGKKIAGDTLGLVGSLINDIGSIFGRETIGDVIEKLLRQGAKLRYCNDLTTTVREFREQFSRGQEKVYEENEKDRKENEGRNQHGIPNMRTRQSFIGGWSSSLDPGFDKGWGQDGPLVVNDGVANGSHQMWVYAVNLGPKYRDNHEKKVALAKGPTVRHGGLVGPTGSAADQRPLGYIAQAEFYYDCDETWSGDNCNGASNDTNASFGIRWRARLRRVHMPNLGRLLASFALDQVLGSEAYTTAKQTIEDTIRGLGNGPLSSIGMGMLSDWVSDRISDFETSIRESVTDAAGNFNPLPTFYH